MTTPDDAPWSDGPVRQPRLTAAELNVSVLSAVAGHASNNPEEQALASDDPTLLKIVSLLREYGGVILAGPPGTSKSWYAAQVAHALSQGVDVRRAFVQLHPSYQYEDFMQGLAPRLDGPGFERTDGVLVRMCRRASATPDVDFVLVVDELSRGEPARVFGEALTYLEQSKRDLPFQLASGEILAIPRNLLIIATMNPADRGVDEVDAAFERRFARVAMDPDPDILDNMLTSNDMEESLRRRLVGFFRMVNRRASSYNASTAVGHTYFARASTRDDLARLWDHQLRFLFERAYRLDGDGLTEVQERWTRVLGAAESAATASAAAGSDEA